MRRDSAGAMPEVIHIDEGRVAFGLLDGRGMARQIGMQDGPCWLNVACAVLGLPSLVDAVASTALRLRRVPLQVFQDEMRALPGMAQSVLRDMAWAHHRQVELAVSRLAKDAEARCAEWLLRHAQPAGDAQGDMWVMLHERKRAIAAQLGIAPETFSRVLRQLRERSLISGSGRVLTLPDPVTLRSVAGL